MVSHVSRLLIYKYVAAGVYKTFHNHLTERGRKAGTVLTVLGLYCPHKKGALNKKGAFEREGALQKKTR